MARKPDTKALKRRDSRPPATPNQVVNIGAESDREGGPDSLRPIGGSGSKNLNSVLANQAAAALWLPAGLTEAERDRRYHAAVVVMMEFKPTDGIEGMMAAQAVGLHSAAMECFRRAMIPEQGGEACDQLRRQAASLTRTFLDLVAALDRKRGKGGQQVVRVERVMVGPGGQAVVGNVTAGAASGIGQHGSGVGRGTETEGEPNAPPAALAHDATLGPILPSLRGADTGRDAVPVAGHAQRPMPDARRSLDGA